MIGIAGLWLIGLLLQSPSSPPGSVEWHAWTAVTADVLPRRDAAELRPELGARIILRPQPRVTMLFDGVVDGLVAKRGGRVSAVSLLVRDAYVETRAAFLDARAGYGRLVWGRLDEIAPTDVINPIDAARFLFDGRSEARLPVPFARVRMSASERLRVEGILVPRFRRGVFDRLAESSSPFNLVTDAVAPAGVAGPDRIQIEPGTGWRDVSGGARVDTTVGRVDASASVYRGFDGIGPVRFLPSPGTGRPPPAGSLFELHPRFTMIGADVETVAGAWGIRGEVAGFVDRSFLSPAATPAGPPPGLVPGRSFDAGAGVDRRAGDWRLFGSVVVHRESLADEASTSRTDVDVVASLERAFGGERHRARGFLVVNPPDGAAFLRGLWTWKIRDDVTFDASAGVFLGASADTIGRFRTRDFMLARTRYDF